MTCVQSLFQDDRGANLGLHGRGLAYFEDGRFIHVSGVPGGQVHSIAGDERGESLDRAPGSRSFSFASAERMVERIPWVTLGRKDLACCSVSLDPVRGRPMAWILCRAAWRISRTVKSAHRTRRRWVGRGPCQRTFNSIGTVRCGPQPRAG